MTREWFLQRNISQSKYFNSQGTGSPLPKGNNILHLTENNEHIHSKELYNLQEMDHIKVTRFDPLKRISPNKGDTYSAAKIQAHSQSKA